jgi:hypothetical protein
MEIRRREAKIFLLSKQIEELEEASESNQPDKENINDPKANENNSQTEIAFL